MRHAGRRRPRSAGCRRPWPTGRSGLLVDGHDPDDWGRVARRRARRAAAARRAGARAPSRTPRGFGWDATADAHARASTGRDRRARPAHRPRRPARGPPWHRDAADGAPDAAADAVRAMLAERSTTRSRRRGTSSSSLPGERKQRTTLLARRREHALSVHAFVARHPDENHEAVYRWLLERNLRHVRRLVRDRPARRRLPRRARCRCTPSRRTRSTGSSARSWSTPTARSTRILELGLRSAHPARVGLARHARRVAPPTSPPSRHLADPSEPGLTGRRAPARRGGAAGCGHERRAVHPGPAPPRREHWNAKNLFTGWVDVDLSDEGRGRGRARRGAAAPTPACCPTWCTPRCCAARSAPRTSRSTRATGTGSRSRRNWRLNERHYGALQGKDKKQTLEEFGEEQFMLWRRSYDTPPPPIDPGDEYAQTDDAALRVAAARAVPRTECLEDVVERLLPYWEDVHRPRPARRPDRPRRRARQLAARAGEAPRRHLATTDIAGSTSPPGSRWSTGSTRTCVRSGPAASTSTRRPPPVPPRRSRTRAADSTDQPVPGPAARSNAASDSDPYSTNRTSSTRVGADRTAHTATGAASSSG